MRLQVGRRLAEVSARRRFDAVIPVAEVHRVQICVEDLLLGIALFETDGNRGLANLARERAGRCELLETHQLLRQGAPSLENATRAPVAPGGLHDSHGVETVMRVEAPILDRQERVDHVGRHAVEWNVDALFHEEGEHLPVLPVEDDGALGMRPDFGERSRVPQLTRHAPRGANRDRGDGPDEHRAQQHAHDQESSSHAAL